MLQLISSRAVNPPQYQQILKEVILLIQQLNSGVQVNAATPLSFAVLSALVIGDDDDDDDVSKVQALPPQGLEPSWVAGALSTGSIHSIPRTAWRTLAHFSLDFV